MKNLTVLSFGGGQDSTAILELYINDPSFRAKYAPYDFIVIMADTGNEHDETYDHVKATEKRCKEHGIKFVLVTTEMGFHSQTWPNLHHQWRLNHSVGSKAFMKTCTDKLKIVPIYNFLGSYIHEEYGLEKHGRKREFIEFAEMYGKIDVLIGIARGEEKRLSKGDVGPKWRQKAINTVYPLIYLGMDRQDCQDYISEAGQEIPMPSNCMTCPHMSLQELLWLHRFKPVEFDKWVVLEAEKVAHWEGRCEKNVGVWGGTVLLPAKLEEAKGLYGSWSNERLQEYKMSHGHCVTSKY